MSYFVIYVYNVKQNKKIKGVGRMSYCILFNTFDKSIFSIIRNQLMYANKLKVT